MTNEEAALELRNMATQLNISPSTKVGQALKKAINLLEDGVKTANDMTEEETRNLLDDLIRGDDDHPLVQKWWFRGR